MCSDAVNINREEHVGPDPPRLPRRMQPFAGARLLCLCSALLILAPDPSLADVSRTLAPSHLLNFSPSCLRWICWGAPAGLGFSEQGFFSTVRMNLLPFLFCAQAF